MTEIKTVADLIAVLQKVPDQSMPPVVYQVIDQESATEIFTISKISKVILSPKDCDSLNENRVTEEISCLLIE